MISAGQAFQAAAAAHRERRLEAAEAGYRRVLALCPAAAQVWQGLGDLLRESGRLEAALAPYRRSARLDPGPALPLACLAGTLKLLGDPAGAAAAARQALARRPDDVAARLNLGAALRDLGAFAAAEAMDRRVVALAPGLPQAYNNLGNALHHLRRPREALAPFARALLLRPDYPEARYNRSLAHLLAGDDAAGWAEYEWRWRRREAPPGRGFDRPQWTGEPLAGRTLLLHAEQGHGDTLQFLRYLPLVAARGGRVLLEVQPALLRLAATVAGAAAVFAQGAPLPAFDCHCPLMSLPLACKTTLATIPARVPYLQADAAARAAWLRRLEDGRLRVGLVWAGDPRPHLPAAAVIDRRRSLPLSVLAPLGTVAGVRLISLQKGSAAAEPRPPGLDLFDPTAELGDFADTAALVAALDLVISADTAVAHLAGALGRPVWLLSRFDGCWRWLLERDDSPWYPTLRLFRQASPGDWSGVVAALTAALRERAASNLALLPSDHKC
jgi:tetratricopeptide (TPR) repeat protein